MRCTVLVATCAAAAIVLIGVAELDAEEPAVPKNLRTVAEASDFKQTAKSDAVVALAKALCAKSTALEAFTFGTTHEGRDMLCVKVARPMVKGPEQLAEDERLVVLLLGNIHSGECCGKEALLMLLRDLALNAEHPWLKDVILLVVPNYNADGNDRFGPNAKNRKGQVGPEEMGVRANAQGFDLNRDFVKLESPEGRALVGLMDAWNPHLFIDCHTTNGSWHRYELTYDIPHNPATPAAVRDLLRGRMMPGVGIAMKTKGYNTFYYGNFNKDHTQWTTYGHQPRYSTEYVGVRGRLAILSEAYSYIPFKDRIFATKDFVEACVNWIRANAADVKKAADARLTPAETVPINAKATAFEEKPKLLGYLEPSLPGGKGPSGHPRVRPPTEAEFEVEFVGNYVPTKTVARPYAYVIPKSLASVVERLQRHGIAVERLTKAAGAKVEVSRIQSATKAAGTFQGHRLIRAKAETRSEERTIEEGSFIVRASQPLGTLAVYLLEAETDDGFVTWEVFGDALKVEADFPVLRIPEPAALELSPAPRK